MTKRIVRLKIGNSALIRKGKVEFAGNLTLKEPLEQAAKAYLKEKWLAKGNIDPSQTETGYIMWWSKRMVWKLNKYFVFAFVEEETENLSEIMETFRVFEDLKKLHKVLKHKVNKT